VAAILRGEVWTADLSPIIGHEQDGIRPVLVVSADRMNQGRSGLVIVVPVTKTRRPVPSHIEICPPEGGLKYVSHALCEQVRSISIDRIRERLGAVTPETLAKVQDWLKVLLDIR
jgi:mRNA interferase MazF